MSALRHLDRLDVPALRIATNPALLQRVTPRFLQQLSVEAIGNEHSERAWRLRELVQAEATWNPSSLKIPKRIDNLARLDDCLTLLAARQARVPANEGVPLPLYAQPFPPAPWPGVQGIQPIADTDDLAMEGEQMQHYVAKYWPDVMEGRIAVYRVQAPVRATLAFRMVQGNWESLQIKGFQNTPVNANVASQIVTALTGLSP